MAPRTEWDEPRLVSWTCLSWYGGGSFLRINLRVLENVEDAI